MDLLSIVVGSFEAFFDDNVPVILSSLMAAIEDHGLETEGIYRLSGNLNNIKSLCEHCYFDDQHDLSNAGIHELTGAVKLILREMYPPITTFIFYQEFLDAVSGDDEAQYADYLLPVLSQIPDTNFAILYNLMQHLKK